MIKGVMIKGVMINGVADAADVANATATIVPVSPNPATNRCQTPGAPAYDGTIVGDARYRGARNRGRCQCERGPTLEDKGEGSATE